MENFEKDYEDELLKIDEFNNSPDEEAKEHIKKYGKLSILYSPVEVLKYVISQNAKINKGTNEFVDEETEDSDLKRAIFYLNYNEFWKFVVSVDNQKCLKNVASNNKADNVTKLPKFDPKSLKNGYSGLENFKDWKKIANNFSGTNNFGLIFGGNPYHHPFGGNALPDNLTVGRGSQIGGEPCNQTIKRIVDTVLTLTKTKYGTNSDEYDNLKKNLDGLLDSNIQSEILINQKVQQLQRLSQSGSATSTAESKEILEQVQKLINTISKNYTQVLNNSLITITSIRKPEPVDGVSPASYFKGGGADVYAKLNAMQAQLDRIASKLNV